MPICISQLLPKEIILSGLIWEHIRQLPQVNLMECHYRDNITSLKIIKGKKIKKRFSNDKKDRIVYSRLRTNSVSLNKCQEIGVEC